MDRTLHDKLRPLLATLWGIGWFGVAALLLLPTPVAVPGRGDLLAHFLLFAGMAFATVSFSRRASQLAGLALLTIVCATALEFAQQLVAHRSFDVTDIAANALGAISGFGLALMVLRVWVRPAARGVGAHDPRVSLVSSPRSSSASGRAARRRRYARESA